MLLFSSAQSTRFWVLCCGALQLALSDLMLLLPPLLLRLFICSSALAAPGCCPIEGLPLSGCAGAAASLRPGDSTARSVSEQQLHGSLASSGASVSTVLPAQLVALFLPRRAARKARSLDRLLQEPLPGMPAPGTRLLSIRLSPAGTPPSAAGGSGASSCAASWVDLPLSTPVRVRESLLPGCVAAASELPTEGPRLPLPANLQTSMRQSADPCKIQPRGNIQAEQQVLAFLVLGVWERLLLEHAGIPGIDVRDVAVQCMNADVWVAQEAQVHTPLVSSSTQLSAATFAGRR